MLFILPQEILRNILQYYLIDKDSNNVVSTCKTLYKIDYLKFLKNRNTDILYFSMLFSKHCKTLNYIVLQNVSDPTPWIPCRWPKKVILRNCFISFEINPSISDTEELIIEKQPCYKQVYSRTLKINWSKFPNLKKLEITTFDLNLTGIEKCTKLEYVYLYCHKQNTQLPKNIYNIPNLKIIITNCLIQDPENMIFISSKLQICIVKNNNYNNIINYNSNRKINSNMGIYYCPNMYHCFLRNKFTLI